jgi:hypothetical protein
MPRDCAPIVLFVYARLDHTQKTLEALKRNFLAEQSDLVIFSDGPKRADVAPAVESVRRYLRSVDGFKSVQIFERQTNLGLAASVTVGVTRLCEARGRVIVMEDDLITSPYFLTFMNDGLDKYADTPQVAAISGFHPPFKARLPDTFFQCDADCWGWATWQRAWEKFNPDGAALLAELKRRQMLRLFDQDGTYPYVRMLEDQVAGRIDSWAIRWRASVILQGMLSLYPRQTLTRNIGLDGSGTHGDLLEVWDDTLGAEPVRLDDVPLVPSKEAFQAFVRFNRYFARKNRWDKLKRRLGLKH